MKKQKENLTVSTGNKRRKTTGKPETIRKASQGNKMEAEIDLSSKPRRRKGR